MRRHAHPRTIAIALLSAIGATTSISRFAMAQGAFPQADVSLDALVPDVGAESISVALGFPGATDDTIFAMHRGQVIDPNIQIDIRGPRSKPSDFTPLRDRVALWSGESADGDWYAFIARSAEGAIGWIEATPHASTADARRFVLVGADPEAIGLVDGPWHFELEGPAAASPVEQFCEVLELDGANGGIAGFSPALRRDFELALDCDNEFAAIFPSNDALLNYVAALYGAIDAIYERDAGFGLRLGFIRIWDQEVDPFNDPDPLYQFRDEWVANQAETPRDLAQLVSGRRRLPYGGVAWLSVACSTNNGYSVVGYMNGRFASATSSNPGNWDIIVSAHELGHNFGTHHTHAYELDSCNAGQIRRGTIMSYCHVVSGASANVDNRFHVVCADKMREFVMPNGCGVLDCNDNGIDDLEEIASGVAPDSNQDGTIDSCQDCNGDGVLDPTEIGLGAHDTDLNGVPDSCQSDCDANGLPDRAECLLDPTIDLDGSGRPDACDPDCDGNGETDRRQTILTPSDDLDRDGRVDSCQDCDGDGTPDGVELGNALGLWTVDGSPNAYELDARSGVRHRLVATGLSQATAIFGLPNGDIVVGGINLLSTPAVRRISLPTGTHSAFTPAGLAIPGQPVRIREVPGELAIVTVRGVVLVDPGTGSHIRTSQLDPSAGALRSIGKHPLLDDLSLHVLHDAAVSLLLTDGSFSQQFTLPEGLRDATDFAFLASGDLIIASREADAIHRYTLDGVLVGQWDVGPNPGSSIALTDPAAMIQAPLHDDVLLTASTSSNATIAGYRLSDGYMERTHRVYAIDAGAAIDLTATAPSPADANRNLVPDECEATTPGDLNSDGIVNGLDLALLLGAWGLPGGDITGDGTTDGGDLAVILGNWS
ncbi:MAG: M12 family metallo-peptidase [Planctomycetota bacterium]|nr:M12 family metallo-peptidase [Planctomycetota bacterium]